jgi:predicted DNA-binding protein with PD1-like motif
MIFRYDGFNYVVRLEKDELLIESLLKFVKEHEVKGAWLMGLGGAQWAELGFYDLPAKEYRYRRFDELLEITSLQGNVAWRAGEPALHIHGTLSNDKFQAIGGHVRELSVAGTCEIFLRTLDSDERLTREPDAQIGLSLLDL